MAELVPLEVVAGVQPSTDATETSTQHYVEADKVRFVDGYPEKIGGWVSKNSVIDGTFRGCARNIYSYTITNATRYLIGTHTGLYSFSAGILRNITPVTTTTTARNNALSTVYDTLGSNPISSTDGSAILTVTDTAHPFNEGDILSFSGATGFNGIAAGDINTTHSIFNITTNTYDIQLTINATGTGAGGGASVVRSSRYVQVVDANSLTEGDTIEISGLAGALGGISAASINKAHSAINVTTSGYDIVTDTFATSAVSASGGNIDIARQISAGTCDQSTSEGYGVGLFGVGLYGVPKFSDNVVLPSIWSFDRFGNLIVGTRGNGEELYSYNPSLGGLPEIVTNAPTEINYVFVSNNICVTLGAGGVGNRIQWSDQGNLTTWTGAATNRAGQDDIEGAQDFLSHCSLRGFNLLFTRNQVYSFRFIDKPFVWETKLIDPSRGLIARNARVVVNGVAYWMGLDNFYMYRGGNLEVIPSNTITQCTAKKYVYEAINSGQESKIFAWYNQNFNEIWWHYPTENEQEPNRVIAYNIRTRVWTTHNLTRSAAEAPTVLGEFPLLATRENVLYDHERGSNDDLEPLQWTLKTPAFYAGTGTISLTGLVFDSDHTGDITYTLGTKMYPREDFNETAYTVADTESKIGYKRNGRFWQYTMSGNALNQAWRAGNYYQLALKSGGK